MAAVYEVVLLVLSRGEADSFIYRLNYAYI